MSTLRLFQALRPEPAAAARVAAVPYDVVSTDEARALAADPLSFLHVSRAEIDCEPGVAQYSDRVYQRARENFSALKALAPLVVDQAPSAYVYRLTMGRHTQTGVAACFAVDAYDTGRIKKHELTRVDKEDDRTRHLIELRAQTGPVFLTYVASAAVDDVVARVVSAPPLFDFLAVDGVHHSVWRVTDLPAAQLVAAFDAVPSLYIADGHHRAASASRARRHFAGAAKTPGPWDGFLAVAFPDRQMNVLPYNRLVRDLNGLSVDGFLERLGRVCTVQPGAATPTRRGHVGMFVGGAWYDVTLPGVTAPHLTQPHLAERLDVSQLQHAVLTPLLGVGDPRSDARIEFVGGARGTEALEARVSSGAAAVAFSMFPVSVADLMAISDAGGIMPPKSTWFEPKLRDGLLSHAW